MNNYITGFNSFFEWCRKAEMTPASWVNPCEGIKLARTQMKSKRAFTQDEAIALHAAAVNDELADRPAWCKVDGSPVMRSGL